jgi:hypothetical protein
MLEVIGGVDDDGELLGRKGASQAEGEFRAADAAGESKK